MAAAATAATAGQMLWLFERECPVPCLNTCSPVGIRRCGFVREGMSQWTALRFQKPPVFLTVPFLSPVCAM